MQLTTIDPAFNTTESLESPAAMRELWDSLCLILDNQTKQWISSLMPEGLLFSCFPHPFVTKEREVWDLWQKHLFLTVVLKGHTPCWSPIQGFEIINACTVMFISHLFKKKKSQTWFSSNELAYLYLVDLFNAHYQCSLRIHWWPITWEPIRMYTLYQKAQFLYSVERSACCPQRVNKLLLWASISLLQWLKHWEKFGLKFGDVSR